MDDAICRGCGRKILWGVTSDGKRIPLDPSAPIYAVNQITDGEPVVTLLPAADRKVQGPWVSHFSTCSNPTPFSKGNRDAR